MASREARLQQRLRGAQRRQVKDVDFGLVFPAAAAPLQPASSNRQTPQPDGSPASELLTQRSSRRTPASQRRASTSDAQEHILPVISHSINDANTSAKRRKLDSDAPPSSSVRSTRSSQKVPRPDLYTLNDDEQQEQPVLEVSSASIEEPTLAETLHESEIIEAPPTSRVRTPSTPARTVEEITESPIDAPGSGHRTRVSILAGSIASSQLHIGLEGGSEIETPIARAQRKRKRREEASRPSPRSSRSRHIQGHSLAIAELDELSPEQSERRDQRPRRVVGDSSELQEPFIPNELEEGEEAEEAIDAELATVILKKNRGRRISRNNPTGSPDLDRPEVSGGVIAKNEKKMSRPNSNPFKQQHQKKQSKPKLKISRKSKARIGSPIPVTVHRLTRAPLYDEDELDAHILNSEIPRTKRGGVNAIDVLSQICHEIISAGLDTLEDGCNNCEDPVLRREYRTKLRAMEAFGNELQTRLLEHTINLDNTFSLEKRLRDEQKKKLSLREGILRIRAEREQVALKMDDIRIRHENETKGAQEKDALNTTVHDIELAIDIGKSTQSDNVDEMTGTDVLLKRVADEVSKKSDSGGVLKQIKEFNAFLERAALLLETRKS